ncbi:PhzF family phenazine biosynthesis protein [Bacteroidota bacterium]|nr:PhzF family phenazine biosynthesis protein [Bacteroidota bacterium]
MKKEIFFVNSFTDQVFSGNPAGVVFYEDELAEDLMQKIAAENNLSETAFINLNSNVIRFFTPTIEVDLCGHATLASAFIFFKFIDHKSKQVKFQSKRGILTAKESNGKIVMDLPRDLPREVKDKSLIQSAIHTNIKEAYKGIDDYMVIVESEEDVLNLDLNFEIIKTLDSRGLIVSSSGKDVDFVSRWFGPQTGVDEDPVTGSAHTLLTPFWAEKLNKTKLRAKQLSRRGGELFCELKENSVLISGNASLYLRGEYFL